LYIGEEEVDRSRARGERCRGMRREETEAKRRDNKAQITIMAFIKAA